jgi:hypothetical protein
VLYFDAELYLIYIGLRIILKWRLSLDSTDAIHSVEGTIAVFSFTMFRKRLAFKLLPLKRKIL